MSNIQGHGKANGAPEPGPGQDPEEGGETQFRILAEYSPFGISIMRSDRTFEYINPEFTRIFGYTIEDVPDKQTWFEKAYPETSYRETVVRTWSGDLDKTIDAGLIASRTFQVRCKDGKKKIILFRNVALKQGKQLMTYEDITARSNAEKALQQSEEDYKKLYEKSKRAEDLYRSLIHSSADAIVIYDMEGRAQYISPSFSEIFGWTPEQVRGERIPFLPESEKETTFSIIRDLLDKGTPCRGYETKRYTKDGRILDVSISASRYHDHEGHPAGMLVILRDISERKRLEAQLLQAHKMEAIGTLAGGVAHDFNNILQAISGYTQLLMIGKESEDPELDKLEAILKSAERATELTKRLLIFGRKVEGRLRPVDLNHEVDQVLKILERTIPRMIKLVVEYADNLEIINADPVQLEQIIMNIAVNARDAMAEGGTLVFRTSNVYLNHEFCKNHLGSRPGEYVCLSIQDDGCGMGEEIIEHIFEPFFTTKDTGKGTGLGLAMVYGIVKTHGGYITCKSQPGRGTAFDIYFPALKGGEVERPVTRISDGEIGSGRETILLVDDDEHVLKIVKSILERFGYLVVTAGSGERAVELVGDRTPYPDLVVLDLNMPGMGGYKCLELLREMDPGLKVIIASGYSCQDQDQKVLTGAAGFIGKPYQLTDMLKKVREVLDDT